MPSVITRTLSAMLLYLFSIVSKITTLALFDLSKIKSLITSISSTVKSLSVLSIISTFWSTNIENNIWNLLISFDNKSLYLEPGLRFKNSKSSVKLSTDTFILNNSSATFRFFNNVKSL